MPESVCCEDELNSSVGCSELTSLIKCEIFANFFQDFVVGPIDVLCQGM